VATESSYPAIGAGRDLHDDSDTTLKERTRFRVPYTWIVPLCAGTPYARAQMPASFLEGPTTRKDRTAHSIQTRRSRATFRVVVVASDIGGYMAGNGYIWRSTKTAMVRPGEPLNTQTTLDLAQLNAFVRSIAWNRPGPSGLNGMKTYHSVASSPTRRTTWRRRRTPGARVFWSPTSLRPLGDYRRWT